MRPPTDAVLLQDLPTIRVGVVVQSYTYPSLLLSIYLVLRLFLACICLLGALLLSRQFKHLCIRQVLLLSYVQRANHSRLQLANTAWQQKSSCSRVLHLFGIGRLVDFSQSFCASFQRFRVKADTSFGILTVRNGAAGGNCGSHARTSTPLPAKIPQRHSDNSGCCADQRQLSTT